MNTLYHFTSVELLHAILNSQGLNKGYLRLVDGQFLYGYTWLTTSPLPYGHGLVNGTEELTEHNREFMRQASRDSLTPDKIRGTLNKQAIRITINYDWLKNQPEFESYIKLMRKLNQPKEYIKILGVEGLVDTKTLNDKQLLRWMKSDKTKETTWYVFNGVIPKEQFISIDFKESEYSYVPYSFESHGRKVMEDSGFFCISKNKLHELNTITNSALIDGSVFALCPNLDLEPCIAFRCDEYTLTVSLKDFSLLVKVGYADAIEKDVGVIVDWVKQEHETLSLLYQQAKEKYIYVSRND